MEYCSILALGSSLRARCDTARTAIRLHVSAGKDGEELQDMLDSLSEIQRGLKELRTTADEEKRHLEYAKSALA